MSAHFYGYRIAKQDLWPLVDDLRAYYQQESPLMLAVEELRQETLKYDDIDKRLEISTKAFEVLQEQHGDQLEVELQLFDAGDDWIFRVLESGTQFKDSFRDQDWPITPVFYDDQTEDLSDPDLLPLVEEIDQEIQLRHYLVTPILTIHEATMRLYDYNSVES